MENPIWYLVILGILQFVVIGYVVPMRKDRKEIDLSIASMRDTIDKRIEAVRTEIDTRMASRMAEIRDNELHHLKEQIEGIDKKLDDIPIELRAVETRLTTQHSQIKDIVDKLDERFVRHLEFHLKRENAEKV